MVRAKYTVVHTTYIVPTPYFQTLCPIQNIGYLSYTVFLSQSLAHVTPALLVAPRPDPTTTHIYLTLLTH